MMRLVPWITLVLAAVLALNPAGYEFIYSAFWSNEALSRNIARPIVLIAIGLLLLLAIAEIVIRYARRR